MVCWRGKNRMSKLNIVLFEPEIPSNTGNIGRTCVATGTRLHLIEPLGFRLNEKAIQRAGMDYWNDLDMTTYLNYEDFLAKNPGAKIYMATTKARQTYAEVQYEEDCYIMFGKESAGIPEEILVQHPDTAIRIPMNENIRSLNLANSVAIVLYEALRQHNFEHMQLQGQLRNFQWLGWGRRPPLPPSRRAWGCSGRRAWRYGMRAHSTFGQHRGQCSPAFRAAGVVWERLFSDRSASVGHCPLCCPSVVASTAFPYLQTRRPKPQPHARREGGSGGLLVVAA